MELYRLNYASKRNSDIASFLNNSTQDKHNEERILLLYITPKIERPYSPKEFHDGRKKKRQGSLSRDPTLSEILNELDSFEDTLFNSLNHSQRKEFSRKLLTGLVYHKNGKFDFANEDRLNLVFKLKRLSNKELERSFYGIKNLISRQEIILSKKSKEFYLSLADELSRFSPIKTYKFLTDYNSASQIIKGMDEEPDLNKKIGLKKYEILLYNNLFRNLMFYTIVRDTLQPAKWPSSPMEEDNVLYFTSYPEEREVRQNHTDRNKPIKKSHFFLVIKTTREEVNAVIGNERYSSKIITAPTKHMSINVK